MKHARDFPNFDWVTQPIMDIFKAAFSCQDTWELFAALPSNTRAPDPHNFGYTKPWGQGMGLPQSQWIPTTHIAAFWTSTLGWEKWRTNSLLPRNDSAHHYLVDIEAIEQRDAVMKHFHTQLTALSQSIALPDAVAIIVPPAVGRLEVYIRQDEMTTTTKMPGCSRVHGAWRI